MTHLEVSKYIKDEFLNPLINTEIKNRNDLFNLHQQLIKVNHTLFSTDYKLMPHYRGEQNFGWNILPGISRPPFNSGIDEKDLRKIEAKGVQLFKERISNEFGEKMLLSLNAKTPHHAKWDLLFQAQHAGVKTNLIDLSTDIMIAAFFACEPSKHFDENPCQLWCILVPKDFIFNASNEFGMDTYPQFDPFHLPKSFVCNVPTYIDTVEQRTYQKRLYKQRGRLFASSDHDLAVPLNKKDVWENLTCRIKIDPDAKKAIFKELANSGISKHSLIPEETKTASTIINAINDEMKKL